MSATAAPASSTDPTARSLWQAARTPLVVLVLVLLAGSALALATAGRGGERLDPGSAAPAGSRALAQLLRGQGVQVVTVGTAAEAAGAAGPGSTLLIVGSDRLSESKLRQLREAGADLVVPAAGEPSLRVLVPSVRLGEGGPAEVREPACTLPTAVRAGAAHTGGVTYLPPADAVACYPGRGGPSLVVVREDGASVTLLGDPAAFTNKRLADEGDAALALGLLGANPRLVWYLPNPSDAASEANRGLFSLVPAGIRFGIAQLAVAVVLLALWRARRLGPVVVEPLPVVVRASESVEGRARLYRRGRARAGSAAHLRAATARRCAARLGLPASAADPARPAALLDRLARATGRPVGEVQALLLGPAPEDDTGLVRLADALDALEREVRRP
ncbi:MAG TPA: DUF4350 domain-containing protein [Motilibacteraceae bacterium]|nr:DUF4350 domain-containing protein [Motilibacteraceae bacterium]